MTTGWQNAEQPDEGIRLRDEAEHVLFFLTDVLYRMVPPFYESLESALAAAFPERGAAHTRADYRAVRQLGRRRHGRQSARHREEHCARRSRASARSRSISTIASAAI